MVLGWFIVQFLSFSKFAKFELLFFLSYVKSSKNARKFRHHCFTISKTLLNLEKSGNQILGKI